MSTNGRKKIIEQKAVNLENDRLFEATWEMAHERMEIGPLGLHSGCDFDRLEWQLHLRRLLRFGPYDGRFPEVAVIFWCRIYLSVVGVDSRMALIQYNFENMYDRDLPVDLKKPLFANFGGFDRLWFTEDVTTGQKEDMRLPLNPIHTIPYEPDPFEYIKPSKILTITLKAPLRDDGWLLSHFGRCLPGHTYKFQFIYGGLPSNVFTWTAPSSET